MTRRHSRVGLFSRVPGEEADGEDGGGEAPGGDYREVEPFEAGAGLEGVEGGLTRFGEVLYGEDVAEDCEPTRRVVEAHEDIGNEQDRQRRGVGDRWGGFGIRRERGEGEAEGAER